MIRVLIGDMFESECQTWVNTVNCVGVMGKGVALEFKKRFPDMFEDYQARCRRKEVKLGKPYLFKRLLRPWILNFPTKSHWRAVTNLDHIVRGLEYLNTHIREWGIESLAVPPLGCGQGQLEWRVVGPTLYRHLRELDILVELYAPYGTPHEELQASFLGPINGREPDSTSMPEPEFVKPEWVALVEIVRRIESEPYHWPVGRTIFQKIAYVATERGLGTGLKFSRASYGPYSPDIKPMLSRLINNGLMEERALGRMLEVRPGRTFVDARKAFQDKLKLFEDVIEKTADLFLRVNTAQAELIATVMYAARELEARMKDRPTESDVFKAVLEWKIRRRPPVQSEEVGGTIRNLTALGWLNVTASADLPIPKEEFADA
jgi:O-acetyl-ADP-ribose deacetylase (regulator of RNase III)/uncharacterized protein YwgA